MPNWKNRELKKKYYVVYKITNTLNGKIYVGFHSTNNLNDNYMGSGKAIKRAIQKYRKENFTKEIIEVFDNQKDAEHLEAEIVNEEFINRPDTYNMVPGGNVCVLWGGNNGFYGKTHTQETIDQIQKNSNWYTPTEDHKRRNSETMKRVWEDEGFRQMMIENRKGRVHSEETKRKISESNIGKTITPETKDLISEKRKEWFKNLTEEKYWDWYNKVYTEERSKKLSELQKGKKCPWNEKNNKDPEKIRKTAEAHRGMKRSEEARKNMSEAAKDKPSKNKGFIWCYNPETKERKMVSSRNEIPKGWAEGQGKEKTPKGKVWCHNPETKEQKTCLIEEIPKGWVRGMGKRNRKK